MGNSKFYLIAFVIALMFAGSAEARLFGLVFDQRQVIDFGADAEDAAERVGPEEQGTLLYEINPETGEASFIGDTGYPLCIGMDFHPFTQELYAVCTPEVIQKGAETRLIDDFVLIKIDIRTAHATEVGPTGIVPGEIGEITDISFRSDGVLFGHGRANGGLILGTFNLNTGEFALIGTEDTEVRPGGLGFLSDGRLFSADTTFNVKNVIDFDTPTVLMHLRGQTAGEADFITDLKLQLNEEQVPFVTSLDTNPADNQLYGYLFDRNTGRPTLSQKALEQPYIAVIDPDTGIVDFRAPTIENVTAIAFLEIPTNIPTMGEWGLIILATSLFFGSLLVMRRRQRRSAV